MSRTEATSPPGARQRVRRGSAEDHASLRSRIIAAAFAIHEREGADAMSMRALAAEVGMSPMALYRYFTNKAELLHALGEVVMTEAESEVIAAIATQQTARARLRASIESFIRYWEAHPARFRLFYMTPETMAPGPEAPMTRTPAYPRVVVGLTVSLINDLIVEVGGRRDRALVARDLRVSLMVGYLHAKIVNTRYPWSDFDALRTSVIDTIALGVENCVRSSK